MAQSWIVSHQENLGLTQSGSPLRGSVFFKLLDEDEDIVVQPAGPDEII